MRLAEHLPALADHAERHAQVRGQPVGDILERLGGHDGAAHLQQRTRERVGEGGGAGAGGGDQRPVRQVRQRRGGGVRGGHELHPDGLGQGADGGGGQLG